MLATLLLALQVFRTHDFKTFSLSDFGEYWAAGRLLLAHRNPYSAPACSPCRARWALPSLTRL